MTGQKKIAVASFAILMVPALFYILLTRGKNEFKRLPITGNLILSDSLTDQKNNHLTSQKVKDKFIVVSFYTINQDTLLNNQLNGHLRKIQSKFSNADDVRIISFVVEGGYGLSSFEYLSQKEGALYGKWYFTDYDYNPSIRNNVETALGISPPVDFRHCFKTIYLIDKQNQIRGIHDGTDSWAVDTLMDEVKLLRWEEWDKEKSKKQ